MLKHSIEKIKRVLKCLSSQYQTKTDLLLFEVAANL